ncbi:hypothetical protein AVHY2522_08825 [Acidovorax sp. SUPP2522]|uniref:hypothetical protein n=1 Tax=unclassified Acidovorax TaxID=2684926 RepID=UPI00234A0BB4|nr:MULTISPECIES: hypothetical protein [unclassified Acidovorax]WCM97095.1 hypothetical protein M5C96_22250 [Acidovorax sp. GBBC 1281]GKT15640.1 hypothetical protein AVHY2522_08825 [Acidovorax sp. SUPP2522]
MSIQFPKNLFSRFNSASERGANAVPEYREPARQGRSKPGAGTGPMPQRRAAGHPADSATATDRRGPAPQKFAGHASAHARRPGAPPIVPVKPTVAQVLSSIPLHEVDRMSPMQVKQFTKLLGGRTLGVDPALLARNWKLLCSQFKGPELQQLLLKKTADVMKFLTAPALPKSPAAQVLAVFQLHEIDRMDPPRLKDLVAILGGHAQGKGPEVRAENWQRLRENFTEPELKQLLLNDTAGVVDFLTALPPPPKADAGGAKADAGPKPDNGPRPQAEPRPNPGPRPNAGAGRQEAPKPSAKVQQEPAAVPAAAGAKPIALAGMKREAAFQALKDRGMSHVQLQQMRQDFLDQVNHGSGASGDALSAKYRAFITDDLSQSGTLRSYAKLFVRPIADEASTGKA